MVDRTKWLPGIVLRALLVLLLLLIGWRILGLGMADARSNSQPEQALQWRARHAAALFLLAEQQVKTAGTLAEAKKNARAALLAYPLEGRAYRVLGQVAEAEKQPEQAHRLFLKAVHYSPRDIESHLWLLNYSLRTENAETAVFHLDRMLRMRIDLLPQLAPTIGGLASFPGSQAALIRCLAKKPAWRSQAISALASQQGAADRYGVFFGQLAKTQGGLSDAEQQAWRQALNQNRQWSLSYLSWAANLPPEQQLGLGNLFNGSFEHEPLGGEFDWQFVHVPGAVIDRVYRDGVSGEKALRVSFEDQRVPFNHVKQTLVLPAARYRLSGKFFADNLRTDTGLVWVVECLEDNKSLATSIPFKGVSQDWEAFTLEFEVPQTACTAQGLTLRLPARVEAEQQIAGSVWFDALRIQKIQ